MDCLVSGDYPRKRLSLVMRSKIQALVGSAQISPGTSPDHGVNGSLGVETGQD